MTAVEAGPGGQRRTEHDRGDPQGRGPYLARRRQPRRDERRQARGVPAGHPEGHRCGARRAPAAAPGGLRRPAGRSVDRASPAPPCSPRPASLASRLPTVDPATLVDQEVAIVRARPERLRDGHRGRSRTGRDRRRPSACGPPSTRAIGSSRTRSRSAVQPAVVSGDQIEFPATATATQVAILDAEALKAMVVGRPLAEARSILEAYGAVQLEAWPDWVSTVPTLDGRVDADAR